MNLNLILPRKIIFGCNSINQLCGEVNKLGGGSVLVITSNGMTKRASFLKLTNILENECLHFGVFSDIKPEPTIDEYISCLEFAKTNKFDIIVGFGGGSVMDVSKKVAMSLSYPKIMIPTTIGTGSEMTHESVLKIDGKKRAFVDEKLVADVAIVDPDFMKTMSSRFIAISGMDALAHAIECYDSKRSNFLIETLSLKAYGLIKDNIFDAVEGDEDAIENMSLASLMAGIAFGNSGTTLAHGLSYPLSNKGIPHGEAVAIVLPYALEFNGFDVNVVKEIKELVKILKLGIKHSMFRTELENNIGEMARIVMEDEKHLSNNPREVSYEDVVGIYEKILGKE